MKRRHVIGIVAISVFIAYSTISFNNALTPYVTFAQAKQTSGVVQVRGVVANDRAAIMNKDKKFQFVLRDETGEEAPIIYNGMKPDGFDQAASIVAVGKFSGSQFAAEKLLVKCPSKYQGGVNKP